MRKPVLFRVTNNLKIGGIQRRLRALLPLLVPNFEVHIVVYKEQGVFFDELADCGVRVHFLPRGGPWDPLFIGKLARLFRCHNADIVHTHSFGGNVSGLSAAALARVPVRIGQVHLCMYHWNGKTALRRKKQILEETLVHRLGTDAVLFVSRESRDYFQAHTGLPDAMLRILHNGLEFPAAVVPVPREEMGAPERRKLIGFVGRISRGKGLERFLEMAREAAASRPGEFYFPIIGKGEDLPTMRAWVLEHGLDGDISFLGERKDIQQCYAALDGLAFCSDVGREGMPGVVLEACAQGLPVLAWRSAPVEEIREYYERIAFWDARPAGEQLDAVLALPSSDQTRLRTEFSIETMRDRTCALYEELLAAKKVRI